MLAGGIGSSVAGTSHGVTSCISRAQPPDGRCPDGSPGAAPTIGWLKQPGSRARMPRSHSSSGAPRRQPDARMVQSSARSRCLST